MLGNNILLAASSLLGGSALAAVIPRGSEGIQGTPHDAYSSSIGVLGCLVNTNRIAYFPTPPGCNNLCKKVTKGERSVHLLHVDQSGGAYDMSFDAWNELVFGVSALEDGQPGGPEDMTIEDADMDDDECQALLKTENKKLPLSASNSMNYIVDCIDNHPNSWVANNIQTYNIQDAICGWGYMEKCDLAYPADNLMHCPERTGVKAAAITKLESKYNVVNVKYSDGHLENAVNASLPVSEEQTSGASSLTKPSGAAFREDEEEDATTPTATTTVPTASPSSTIPPIQALVILGAMLKNGLRE